MNRTDDNMKDLLQKYHAGKIAKEEFRRLRDVVNRTDDEELKTLLKEHWDSYEDCSSLPQEKVQALFGNLRHQMKRVPIGNQRKFYWLQIAAGFLLIAAMGFSIAFFSQRSEMEHLSAQSVTIRSGETAPSSVLLPDGTEVRLNVNSTLTYQQNFGRTDRRVALSGEGYFKVRRNESKRFVVHTDVMDITVLGTTFNVYAYEDKDFCEMALVEGNVCVNATAFPQKMLYAKPNEKITYNKHTGELSLETTSTKAETVWMSDEIVFRHEPLQEVFRCLERRFDVTFSVNDTTFRNDAYTGVFHEKNIEDILDILRQHYGFDYKRTGDEIRIRMKP